MPVPSAVAATAVLVAGALAVLPTGAAAAPTLSADRACYTPGQRVALNGAGYTPGGQVILLAALSGDRGGSSSSFPLGSPLVADAAGAFGVRVRAPDLASDRDLRERLTITANDQVRATAQPPLPPAEQSGTVQVTLSAWGIAVRAWIDGRGDPRASTDLIALGWEPFRRIYAHYFVRGTRVRSVRVGAVSGPCGDLRTRVRQFPFRPVRAGRWTVYFSPTRGFDRRGSWIRTRVVVPRSAEVGPRR
jgi:hypothetical protein